MNNITDLSKNKRDSKLKYENKRISDEEEIRSIGINDNEKDVHEITDAEIIKEIFEKEKSEYTFRSLQSLYKSALDLKEKFPKIFIQFTIIDIGSDQDSKNKLITYFKDFPFKFINLDKKKINIEPVTINKNNKIIENNMAKTMKSIYESFDQGQKCKDLIYFVEDDYIHKTESLAEMVFAYEKFSSIFSSPKTNKTWWKLWCRCRRGACLGGPPRRTRRS